ncbi:MAG: superoxide dismutase [Planctomycetes bacterium]|nr:superoxide dismutase [Planctomycetota bacterium]
MKHVFAKVVISVFALLIFGIFVEKVYSHCQIPCGIYDDQARFAQIAEDIVTIEKSMKEITRLSGAKKKDMNQIVRWVNNKDHHAESLGETVTYYFMAQRIKPVKAGQGKAYDKYVKEVSLLHRMLVHSMKAKQSTDMAHVSALRSLLAEFEEMAKTQ